jgi:8-oxo-dGTP pyrophosphatase MutT (NUDIX family)
VLQADAAVTISESHPGLLPLREALDAHEPRLFPDERRRLEAAVAVIARQAAGGLEVLLIHRAANPRDPWSGHMAFPGGKVDARDNGSFAAALRETSEEIGLDLGTCAESIGRLSDAQPLGRGRRLGVVIVPHVFDIGGDPEMTPNDEVQDVVWVPLSHLADRSNRSKMWWRRGLLPLRFPCCRYRGHVIWGVTLRILDELIGVLRS